jgi:hypothetical protein
MGKHAKPEPPKQDPDKFNETVKNLPVYECQHTGRVVAAGRIVCSGCGRDYGPASTQAQGDYT